MITTAQFTLPRTMSRALFADKHSFDVSRMSARASEPAIGQRTPDGTVYAGISPSNGRPMYTTPKDSGLCGSWYKAMTHAARLKAHGHKGWRLPTKTELNQLFSHRAAIGNFDETGHIERGWYWSSPMGIDGGAWIQRFRDGRQVYYDFLKDGAASLRCVRG